MLLISNHLALVGQILLISVNLLFIWARWAQIVVNLLVITNKGPEGPFVSNCYYYWGLWPQLVVTSSSY